MSLEYEPASEPLHISVKLLSHRTGLSGAGLGVSGGLTGCGVFSDLRVKSGL